MPLTLGRENKSRLSVAVQPHWTGAVQKQLGNLKEKLFHANFPLNLCLCAVTLCKYVFSLASVMRRQIKDDCNSA